MNLFQAQNRIGKQGEADVYEYYKDKAKVIDVSGDREYQIADIDFLIDGYGYEVKTRRYQRGQITVELVSNLSDTRFKDGWLYSSAADFFIFYCLEDGSALKIDRSDLIWYYERHKSTITKQVYGVNEFDGAYKESLLAHIDIARLLDETDAELIQIKER